MGLQEAINAAPQGGVVRVPAGRPAGQIGTHDVVTLLGEPGSPLLDEEEQGSAVVVDVPPGTEVKLYGLIFQNGAAPAGGGLLARSGVVLVQRSIFRHCKAPTYGGGAVYASGEELTLEACQLLDCQGRQGG